MKKILFFIILFSLLCGSCRNYSARVEKVLKYSGPNRPELEKVLRHYSRNPQDSLKLRAALFLIENMPGHYTLESETLQKYRDKLDSTKGIEQHVKKMMQTIPYHYPEQRSQMTIREDVKYIRGDYLISRIDKAFSQWHENPWLKDTDYETFRDYLLPYRIEYEPLDYWRDSISAFQDHINECLKWYDNSQRSLQEFANMFFLFNNNLPHKVTDPLYQNYQYDCTSTSLTELFAMYIIGIPAAIDFTPGFANHNGRHYWTTTIDPRINNAECYQVKLNTTGKIYRRTYAHQPTPKYTGKEYIPPFFRNPFQKDVTALYLQTCDVRLKIRNPASNRYAYLATFNDLQWKPIAYTEIKKKRATFKNMGKHIVYLPVCYDSREEMQPVAPPFILHKNGSIQYLNCRRDSLQTLILKRKYPFQSLSDYWTKALINTRFERADNPAFKQAETAAMIEKQPDNSINSIKITNPVPKRYWRVVFPGTGNYLAELQFFNPQGRLKTGKPFSPNSIRTQVLFDNDPLSNVYIWDWLGMDFGQPENITEIRYLPRNDANGIFPGDEYELFYYCFPEGWVSMGKQVATTYSLTYKNVPAGTLYWLRNLTAGVEERIFTWENNKARFW